ncbi:Head binding protein [compost metagenome]
MERRHFIKSFLSFLGGGAVASAAWVKHSSYPVAEVIPNVVVSMPSQLFTLARSFKAAANGKIYIGNIDTDPTIPENQIQVYVENEDGSLVPIAQPIIINAGGYPVYGGQISKFVTVEGHSMAVYDAYNVQQFYFPNVLRYDPDQFAFRLSQPDGQKYVGLCPDVITLKTIEPSYDGQRIALRQYTLGTGLGGGQLRAVVDGAALTDNGATIFKTAGGAAWVRVNADIINTLMAGANPVDGVDNADAINRAIVAGSRVEFAEGNYKYSKQIVLKSGLSLDLRGAKLYPSDMTESTIFGDGVSDVDIVGGYIEGSGNRFSTDSSLIQLNNCSKVRVSRTRLEKGSADGLRMISCNDCTITDVDSNHNYDVGIQDRDGSYNLIQGCSAYFNGNTGVVSHNGGRGILLWRTVGTLSDSCKVGYNTEYGFRVYSQSGDSIPSRNIMVSNLRCVENAKIDVYVFNDQGAITDITFTNVMIERFTDPQDTCLAVQGTRTKVLGVSITKRGTRLTRHAIGLYLANKCFIDAVTVGNCGQVISHSESVDNTVSRVIGDCSKMGPLGVRTTYSDCYLIHAGTGTTDVAIEATETNPDYSGTVSNCRFDNFHRVISWVAHSLSIINNTSHGTTDVDLKMYEDGIPRLFMSGNRWSANCSPTLLNTYTRQGGEATSKPIYFDNFAPTSYTWPVGARVQRAIPVVGAPKGWMCTVAGTPGTWVSEGNL